METKAWQVEVIGGPVETITTVATASMLKMFHPGHKLV